MCKNLQDVSDSILKKICHEIAISIENNNLSFEEIKNKATPYKLSAAEMAVILESDIANPNGGNYKAINNIISETSTRLLDIMYPAIFNGQNTSDKLQFLDKTWDIDQEIKSINNFNVSTAWKAHVYAMNVQKYNASMGVIAAAPTGGASGTVPATIKALSEDLDATPSKQVEALLVAGLIGKIAFSRGPVSGSQAGCGGEIGVAAGMAAGAAVYLLGGSWEEIDNASSLVMQNYMSLECSPALGLVEYPCVPRNGFAAVSSIIAAITAISGIESPYKIDETLDRIFSLGAALPVSLRETESKHWMNQFLTDTVNKITNIKMVEL